MSDKTEHEKLGDAFRKTMLAHHAANTYEAERVRIAVSAKLRERGILDDVTGPIRDAIEAEVHAAIAAKQQAAREGAKRGVEMPSPTAPTIYIDPVSGQAVAFPSSTEPPSRGMLPPTPPR